MSDSTGAAVQYAYDRNGNKIKQTDVSGKVTEYAYSSLDLLEKVWDDGRELAEYAYNADGTLHEERHGPLHKRYWYDLDKNLVGIHIHNGGEMLVDNQYLYDSNGNRTNKHQLGGDSLYHYDPLNQLKKVEYPGYTEELFYDKAGNRTHDTCLAVKIPVGIVVYDGLVGYQGVIYLGDENFRQTFIPNAKSVRQVIDFYHLE